MGGTLGLAVDERGMTVDIELRARRVGLVALFVYLAASALVLVVGGVLRRTEGPGWFAVVVHGLALGVTLSALARPREVGWRRTVAAWLPLVMIPVLYAEIPALIASLGTTMRDPLVQGWEMRLFGGQPAAELAGRLPSPWVSEVLHGAYLSYYLILFAPAAWLWSRGERGAFARVVAAVTVAYLACFTVFALFPVAGPRYLWPPPVGAPEGPLRLATLWLLERGSSRGAAFPSSHVADALAVALAVTIWSRSKVMGVALVALTALLAMGAVYGGFHYAVDALGGVVVAGGAVLVVLFATGSSPHPDDAQPV